MSIFSIDDKANKEEHILHVIERSIVVRNWFSYPRKETALIFYRFIRSQSLWRWSKRVETNLLVCVLSELCILRCGIVIDLI